MNPLLKKRFWSILLLIIIIIDSFGISLDMFSFYPIKRTMSNIEVFHQSKIGETTLTQAQYQALIWLKDELENEGNYLIVSTGRFNFYASFVLSLNGEREINYDLPLFELESSIRAIDNIVFNDLIEGTVYFSIQNIDKIYFLVDLLSPLGQKIVRQFQRRVLFNKLYENSDTIIAIYDVTKTMNLINIMFSSLNLVVELPNREYNVTPEYLGYNHFPYFRLLVVGNEFEIKKVPQFLIIEDINPKPNKLVVEPGIIYVEGPAQVYTILFSSVFPFLDIRWTSFPLNKFTKQEGVEVKFNMNHLLVQVGSLYKGIIYELNDLEAKDTYLIVSYTVIKGLMDVYVISPSYNSTLVLSSKVTEWNLAIIKLDIATFEKLRYLKIQGSIVPAEFLIKYVLLAKMP